MIGDIISVLALVISTVALLGQSLIVAMIYEVRERIEAIEAVVYDEDGPDDGDEAEPHPHPADVVELRGRRAA